MSPWWNEAVGTYIGAFGGAGIGVLCGTFGAPARGLSRQGKARGFVLGFHGTVVVLGALVRAASGVTRARYWGRAYPALGGIDR